MEQTGTRMNNKEKNKGSPVGKKSSENRHRYAGALGYFIKNPCGRMILFLWNKDGTRENKRTQRNLPESLILLEPTNRFELLTCALRVRCSTPEPRRLTLRNHAYFPAL